ncbi:hypothetical protein D3C76_1225730 [compost metagenome]
MVVDHHADIMPGGVHINVQVDGRGDVPLPFDHLALLVEAHDIRGGHFTPGQFPGVGQVSAVILANGDVAGDVVVIAFAIQHPTQQRHALLG